MNRLTVLVLKSFKRAPYALLCGVLWAAPQDGAPKLTVQVVEGQNAINNIGRNTAYEPIVEVRDAAGKAVPGASVSFVLPTIGPGALFPDGSRELMVQTDATGRAAGRGLRPNNQVGQFEIRVIAAFEGARATTTVTQTNAAPVVTSTRSGKKLAIILGLVGGGAAAALAAASGGGGGGGTNTPGGPSGDPVSGSITPGTPGFGPPQ
jgi:hypothetical protein